MSTRSEATGVLSREERESFERDGFLTLDSTGLPPALLDGLVTDLAGLYDRNEEVDGVGYQRHRIRNAWKINDKVKSVALAPRVLAILEELYGRKPFPFQTLNFRMGTQQAVHSDALHFNTEPPNYMCGVWVALEDMDMDNGPLVYYPGSHKLPVVRMQDVGVEADRDQYPEYERFIADLIERQALEPEYSLIRKGQAILWSANILHGGAPRRDKNRTRLSQVTHYYFEGCRYYTPMLSSEDHVHWYEPGRVA